MLSWGRANRLLYACSGFLQPRRYATVGRWMSYAAIRMLAAQPFESETSSHLRDPFVCTVTSVSTLPRRRRHRRAADVPRAMCSRYHILRVKFFHRQLTWDIVRLVAFRGPVRLKSHFERRRPFICDREAIFDSAAACVFCRHLPCSLCHRSTF